MEFNKDGCKVNDVQKVVVAEAQKDKNLYLLNVKVQKDTAHIANSLDEGARLKELDAMVDGMNLKEISLHHVCEVCMKRKH